MPARRRAVLVLSLLAALSAASILLALAAGSFSIGTGDIMEALLGARSTTAHEIVGDLRLPRALGAFACGALLALAGALMQLLLRNPLADPYVLGVSGGAAVGALLGMLFGFGIVMTDLFAFSGALAAMLIVFGLARGEGSWTQTRLLLTGVIVAAGCGAAVALILSIAPEQQLHGMLFWLMGDAGQTTEPRPALLIMALGVILVMPFARDLNLLARGETTARTLGVAVSRLRLLIYLLSSVLTAVAVTTAGSIGFVGLIVPHLMRLAIGNDQRLLLPAAALAGGTLLACADTLARTLIAPQQLPVGVLTALIGVPVFLFLLARHPR